MRLLVFYGVCERESSFASVVLNQLLDILAGHEVEVAIQDDASPSHVGSRLQDELASRVPTRVIRLDRSLGYHGTYERAVSFLDRAVGWGERFDYLLRIDSDSHFVTDRLRDLFEPNCLPAVGMVGPMLDMRLRDFVLFLADLFPVGLRRRWRNGVMEHAWELGRVRPVWWHDIGRLSLRNGFRGRIVPGVLQVLSWQSVVQMAANGWLARPRRETGFIFQDDLIVTMLTVALGHPVVDIAEVVPGFRTELFLPNGTPSREVRDRALDLVHPLKDNPWAHALRRELQRLGEEADTQTDG